MSTPKYQGLRKKLSENKNWPLRYMFKFIVSNSDGKVEQVTDLLPPNGEISYKHTKSLRHISITCIAEMPSVNDIISVLEQVDQIEDVIGL